MSAPEPLAWTTSVSGGLLAQVFGQLFPPASPLPDGDFNIARSHQNLITVSFETVPACEVLLRAYGMAGQVQRAPAGWRIAASVLFATAPGKQDKLLRNYAEALAQDQSRLVIRVPFDRRWRLLRISELPRWDFTRSPTGRLHKARPDGLPTELADDFDLLMAHLVEGAEAGGTGTVIDLPGRETA